MKLAYTIPNKLWWIQNFLPPDVFKFVHEQVIKDRNKILFQSCEGIWQKNLHENLVPPQIVKIKGFSLFDHIATLVKHNPFIKGKVNEISTLLYYMKKGSGINWHDDTNAKYGATLYLNNRWSTKWGGEFMFKHKNGHGWIPPTANSLILIKSPVIHKVNTIIGTEVPRITIQMFLK